MASIADVFRGHPPQVYSLTQVAMWHIAGYAGLVGHLVLIVTAVPAEYGYGWTDAEAVRLYGLFTGLIFGAPLLGGWLADAFVGQRRAAILGMWLQAVAFFGLVSVGFVPAMFGWALDAPVREMILAADVPIARLGLSDAETARLLAAAAAHAVGGAGGEGLGGTAISAYTAMSVAFYGSLGVLVTGYGLHSPALAAIIGSLYEGSRTRREGGYTLLFMAAMIGFIVGALVSGMIASRLGWPEALVFAGLATVVAAVIVSRVRLHGTGPGSVATGKSAGLPRLSLSRTERRRVMAIATLCLAYFVFIAAFEQWGGSFSLYVENRTDRIVGGFEIPTLWIHSAQALFVIIVGPVMLAVWNGLDERGVCRAPPAKMGVGLLLTAAAFLIMVAILPTGAGAGAGPTHLFWPLAFYWVVTFGQMTVIPVGQAFVSREAPQRLTSTMMGVWMLFGGLGAWVAGQMGALAGPFGIRDVYLGIVLGCTLTGVAAVIFRNHIMRLLTR